MVILGVGEGSRTTPPPPSFCLSIFYFFYTDFISCRGEKISVCESPFSQMQAEHGERYLENSLSASTRLWLQSNFLLGAKKLVDSGHFCSGNWCRACLFFPLLITFIQVFNTHVLSACCVPGTLTAVHLPFYGGIPASMWVTLRNCLILLTNHSHIYQFTINPSGGQGIHFRERNVQKQGISVTCPRPRWPRWHEHNCVAQWFHMKG